MKSEKTFFFIILIVFLLFLAILSRDKSENEIGSYKTENYDADSSRDKSELNRTRDLVKSYWGTDAWKNMTLNEYLKRHNASL